MPFPNKEERFGFSGCVEFHGEDLSELNSVWFPKKILPGAAKEVARRASQRQRKHETAGREGEETVWPANNRTYKIQRHFGVWFPSKKEQESI